MATLLTATALVSLLHGLIPSHWLPILAVGRREGWPSHKIYKVTLWAGLAHVLSTVILGLGLAALGAYLHDLATTFSQLIAPLILAVLGIFYVIEHYRHHHFHLNKMGKSRNIIWALAIAMFFSPCLEVEAYFLAAGMFGWPFVVSIAVIYGTISILGMLIWVRLALHGLNRLNWHAWEHQAGLITGVTLIISGIIIWLHP